MYSSIELNHSQDFSSSVFILKERGADLKYTMPVTSRFVTVELGKLGSRLIERSFINSNNSSMGYSLEMQPVSNNWRNSKIPYAELTGE